MFSHQNKIKKTVFPKVEKNLLQKMGIDALKNASNFDELYEIVKKCKVSGCGKLMIYDTAFRIGSALDIVPKKIYLHRGAKVGVRNYLRTINGRELQQEQTINRNEIRFPLNKLTAAQLEHFFCHYRNIFKLKKNI